MIRKLMLLGLLLAFLTTTTAVFAGEVVVTKNGKKYHKASCTLVKNKEVEKTDENEAIKNGYKPCKKCFKDEKQTEKK